MKSRISLRSVLFVSTLSTAMVVAGAILNHTSLVSAFNPQPDPPAVVFGITREQTARLSAANLNDESTAPVVIQFTFKNSMGQILALSVQSVEAGDATFFDFNGGSTAVENNRIQLVGEVKVLSRPPDPDRTRIRVISDLEIFDNLGPDAGKSRICVSQ